MSITPRTNGRGLTRSQPAPRTPWTRADDAAYREAVATPVPDDLDTILADMAREIEAAVIRARARVRLDEIDKAATR